MRAAVAAQRRAVRSVQRSFDANREFHLALVAASGNEFLVELAERLWVARIGATIYERQVETQERMLLDVGEHEQILAAIEAGDGRRAESLTRRHLGRRDEALARHPGASPPTGMPGALVPAPGTIHARNLRPVEHPVRNFRHYRPERSLRDGFLGLETRNPEFPAPPI